MTHKGYSNVFHGVFASRAQFFNINGCCAPACAMQLPTQWHICTHPQGRPAEAAIGKGNMKQQWNNYETVQSCSFSVGDRFGNHRKEAGLNSRPWHFENRNQSSACSSTPPWLLSDWPLSGLVLDSRRFYTEECMGESWKCSKPPLNLEPKWSLSWPREILAALKPNIRFAKWTMLRALMRPSKYDVMMWNDMEMCRMIWNDTFFPALSWSLEMELRQMYARPLRFVDLATRKAMKRHTMAHL